MKKVIAEMQKFYLTPLRDKAIGFRSAENSADDHLIDEGPNLITSKIRVFSGRFKCYEI